MSGSGGWGYQYCQPTQLKLKNRCLKRNNKSNKTLLFVIIIIIIIIINNNNNNYNKSREINTIYVVYSDTENAILLNYTEMDS